MILYSKSGEFIGMGKEELSILGFGDMDDFLSEHNDFADLFVNKPGYIFKFKNFSWIDYALHSGAPKKSSIIRLRDGGEIEINLRIKEIYLKELAQEQNIYYSVEVSTHAFEQMPTSITSPLDTASPEQEKSDFKEDSPFIQKEQEPEVKFEETIQSEEETLDDKSVIEIEDYPQENEKINIEEESIPLEVPNETETSFSEDIGVKLKVDQDVHEPSQKEQIIEEETSFIKDYEPDVKINFDEEDSLQQESIEAIDFLEEHGIDEPQIEIKEDSLLQEAEPNLHFDLGDCAQNLDLDISTIAEIINEYVTNLETNIPKLHEYILNNQEKEFEDAIYKLKGVADSLNIEDFSSQFNKILAQKDEESEIEQLKVLEKLFLQFKEKLT